MGVRVSYKYPLPQCLGVQGEKLTPEPHWVPNLIFEILSVELKLFLKQ
jgi:hypothetical protein